MFASGRVHPHAAPGRLWSNYADGTNPPLHNFDRSCLRFSERAVDSASCCRCFRIFDFDPGFRWTRAVRRTVSVSVAMDWEKLIVWIQHI
jgi:hypothetical protein